MSEPIDPIRAQNERRSRERRSEQRRKASTGTALVLSPQPAAQRESDEQPAPDANADAAFTAQILGQTGQKRGLKGGAPVLEQARSAYLEAAYSGPLDRRPPPGRVAKTDI